MSIEKFDMVLNQVVKIYHKEVVINLNKAKKIVAKKLSYSVVNLST